MTAAPELLARIERARYVLAGKGDDADALCRSLRAAGVAPVIPGRSIWKRATRYDKLAANFLLGRHSLPLRLGYARVWTLTSSFV